MTVTALVVDDEAPARNEILYLLKEVTDVEIVGQASSGSDAVKLLGTISPQLVFLDIQMPGMDGFDVGVGFTAVSPSARCLYHSLRPVRHTRL